MTVCVCVLCVYAYVCEKIAHVQCQSGRVISIPPKSNKVTIQKVLESYQYLGSTTQVAERLKIIFLCIYFDISCNVEVVVPKCRQFSRDNCWPACSNYHPSDIRYNVAKIRVWVTTDDLHCIFLFLFLYSLFLAVSLPLSHYLHIPLSVALSLSLVFLSSVSVSLSI